MPKNTPDWEWIFGLSINEDLRWVATRVDVRDGDPYVYLADVLAKIVNGHANSAIDDLLPWAYAKAEPLSAVA